MRTAGALVLTGLILGTLASSCQKPSREEASRALPAPPPATVAERVAARPAWLGIADSLGAVNFDTDPHTFACVDCHGNRPKKTAAEWKATCTDSDCHFRAWPKTVYHRVELASFNTCVNCHIPHVWKAVGEDCRSCHAPAGTPAAATHPLAVAAMERFPHDRHGAYDCATCHDSKDQHASLTKSPADCRSCHHGPPAIADCAACHTEAEVGRMKPQAVFMPLADGRPARQRTLPFDHDLHAVMGCETCHTPPYEVKPKVDCATCHDSHHTPDSPCESCHRPPPEGVHPVSLHEEGCQGSGCHTQSGFEAMKDSRRLCLTCHQAQVEHQPGKDCSSCHMVTLGQTPGGGS